MSGVSPNMLCGMTSIESRHSPPRMAGFFVVCAGDSISGQRAMQSQIVNPHPPAESALCRTISSPPTPATIPRAYHAPPNPPPQPENPRPRAATSPDYPEISTPTSSQPDSTPRTESHPKHEKSPHPTPRPSHLPPSPNPPPNRRPHFPHHYCLNFLVHRSASATPTPPIFPNPTSPPLTPAPSFSSKEKHHPQNQCSPAKPAPQSRPDHTPHPPQLQTPAQIPHPERIPATLGAKFHPDPADAAESRPKNSFAKRTTATRPTL